MSATVRIALAAALVATMSTVASAQFGGNGLSGMGVGLSVLTPIGKFEENVGNGFGLVVHTGSANDLTTWGLRSSFSFDRFNGKGPLNNVQFIGGGFDFVHHSTPGFYQFAGVILSSATYTYSGGSSGGAAGRNGSNFGLNGGIGVNFGSEEGTRTFIEFAASTMFTGANNSNWFPIRLGIRF